MGGPPGAEVRSALKPDGRLVWFGNWWVGIRRPHVAPEQGKDVTVVSPLATGSDGLDRCAWCVGDPLYEAYHDDEWGRPIRDDQTLFALLMLEGFQAGLSWRTILYKRENFERAFHGWDPAAIAQYD